jgi:hypothetical protein
MGLFELICWWRHNINPDYQIYKRDDFNFATMNFQHLHIKIPTAPTYEVYVAYTCIVIYK